MIPRARIASPSTCAPGRPRRRPMMMRCALSSDGTPRLRAAEVLCGRRRSGVRSSPACRGWTSIASDRDIRTLDRHPLASVGSLVLGLRCSWCPGSAPMPRSSGCMRCRRRRTSARPLIEEHLPRRSRSAAALDDPERTSPFARVLVRTSRSSHQWRVAYQRSIGFLAAGPTPRGRSELFRQAAPLKSLPNRDLNW
jgi:hypothetical protein